MPVKQQKRNEAWSQIEKDPKRSTAFLALRNHNHAANEVLPLPSPAVFLQLARSRVRQGRGTWGKALGVFPF